MQHVIDFTADKVDAYGVWLDCETSNFADVNYSKVCPCNQPVLSNESKVSCSRKQWEPLMGFKLRTDRL